MNLSKPFIEKPIYAIVLSLLIFALGLVSIPLLPVGEYPEVVPPSVVVRAVEDLVTARSVFANACRLAKT